MPLVKINLIKGKTTEYKNNISDAIHKSLVETANVPLKDKFQLINEYDENNFIFDAEYSNANRTNNLIIIEIILNSGRTLEVKKNLFNAIATNLNQSVGISKDDVLISLQEVTKENWSFAFGVATYA